VCVANKVGNYKIVLEAKIYESIKDPTYPYYNP
jgi:hypothetical protein